MNTTTTKPHPRVEYLLAMGFDLTEFRKGTRTINVKCSQCCACTIQGTPCHERGCRNEMKECHGCGNIVPRGVKYCADCM